MINPIPLREGSPLMIESSGMASRALRARLRYYHTNIDTSAPAQHLASLFRTNTTAVSRILSNNYGRPFQRDRDSDNDRKYVSKTFIERAKKHFQGYMHTLRKAASSSDKPSSSAAPRGRKPQVPESPTPSPPPEQKKASKRKYMTVEDEDDEDEEFQGPPERKRARKADDQSASTPERKRKRSKRTPSAVVVTSDNEPEKPVSRRIRTRSTKTPSSSQDSEATAVEPESPSKSPDTKTPKPRTPRRDKREVRRFFAARNYLEDSLLATLIQHGFGPSELAAIRGWDRGLISESLMEMLKVAGTEDEDFEEKRWASKITFLATVISLEHEESWEALKTYVGM